MPRRKRAAAFFSAQTDFADLLQTSVAATAATGPGTVAEMPAAPVWHPAPMAGLVPVYGVKLVRLGSFTLVERPRIRSPADVVQLLQKHLQGADRELFVVVLLDTKNWVIGASTVSVGDLTTAVAHPREVFKPAILANASSILLAHNHPSGDPTPSPEDIAVTRRLADGGALLGIDVLDHIVLGEYGRFVSIRETGLCDFPNGTSTRLSEAGRAAGLAL